MKLSIVIPVYNVGYFALDRCLSSIKEIRERLEEKGGLDTEVIVVNDASLEWLSEYDACKKYNLSVVMHEKNKGLGAARNTGLSKVTGDYVWFIDSDDYLNVSAPLNQLFDLLYRNLYIIQIGGIYEYPDKSEYAYFNTYDIKYYHARYAYADNSHFPACVWSKIYKVDFLKSYSLTNPEGIYFEDQVFWIRCISSILFDEEPRIAICPTELYVYCYNPNSIMNCDWGFKKIIDAFKVSKWCISELDRIKKITNLNYDKRLVEYENLMKMGTDNLMNQDKNGQLSYRVKTKLEFWDGRL